MQQNHLTISSDLLQTKAGYESGRSLVFYFEVDYRVTNAEILRTLPFIPPSVIHLT